MTKQAAEVPTGGGFCTSGGSGLGSSATNLHAFAPGARWLDGERFSNSTAQDAATQWGSVLDLKIEN